jgi:hypothetical protein
MLSHHLKVDPVTGQRWYVASYDGPVISDASTARPPRWGLQWRLGESRVRLEIHTETEERAHEALRDAALGLAARLEAWAKQPYHPLKPKRALECEELYLVEEGD